MYILYILYNIYTIYTLHIVYILYILYIVHIVYILYIPYILYILCILYILYIVYIYTIYISADPLSGRACGNKQRALYHLCSSPIFLLICVYYSPALALACPSARAIIIFLFANID